MTICDWCKKESVEIIEGFFLCARLLFCPQCFEGLGGEKEGG